jgi:hypothetical protein
MKRWFAVLLPLMVGCGGLILAEEPVPCEGGNCVDPRIDGGPPGWGCKRRTCADYPGSQSSAELSDGCGGTISCGGPLAPSAPGQPQPNPGPPPVTQPPSPPASPPVTPPPVTPPVTPPATTPPWIWECEATTWWAPAVEPPAVPPQNPTTTWERYDFQLATPDFVACQEYGRWVGVSLCTGSRYNILLGTSREGPFYMIGDSFGRGEDHCELLVPSFKLPVGTDITSGCPSCWIDRALVMQSVPMYHRIGLGERFCFGQNPTGDVAVSNRGLPAVSTSRPDLRDQGVSKTLPGFINPRGSSARLMAFMVAISAGDRE